MASTEELRTLNTISTGISYAAFSDPYTPEVDLLLPYWGLKGQPVLTGCRVNKKLDLKHQAGCEMHFYFIRFTWLMNWVVIFSSRVLSNEFSSSFNFLYLKLL